MKKTDRWHRKPIIVGMGGTLHAPSNSLRALEHALDAARAAGAATTLLPLLELELPFFRPGKPLEAYPRSVHHMLDMIRGADGLLLSSAAYHGTLAGVTKNALDFLQFLSGGERPYLDRRVVGLIATAGGEQAGVRTVDAMVHVAHALRATVVPLQVVIPQAHRVWSEEGAIRDEKWAERLEQLGRLVVERATPILSESATMEHAA